MRWSTPEQASAAERPAAAWLDALAARLEGRAERSALAPLECLKRGRRKALYRVAAPGGGTLLVKVNRYADGAGRARRLRASKAQRELRVAGRLRAAGIPTPLPLAAGESRERGRLALCCLVLRELPGACDLAQHASRGLGARERRALARALGQLARQLHDAGLDQPDFAPNNLLRLASGELVPIDFERARFRRRVSQRRRLAMLAQLEARHPDAGTAELWRALCAYCRGEREAARRLLPALGAARRRLARRELAHWRRAAARADRRLAPLARGDWRGVALRGHPALAGLEPGAAGSGAASLAVSEHRATTPARLFGSASWLHARGLHAQPIACLARAGELRLWVAPEPGARALAGSGTAPPLAAARRAAERRLARALGRPLEIPAALWLAAPRPGRGGLRLQLCAPPPELC